MSDADRVRLERIARKLAAVRAFAVLPNAFGAERHRFELEAPASESLVTEFEERHEVALPSGYRLFVTELGDGGAGPGYRMRALAEACGGGCRPGHLARPSQYLPGPRYSGDWELRHEEPWRPDRIFLPGTLRIADHGCSLFTQLVVTGPARGRLFNLDDEGQAGPYVVEDADFLAWYERWLDEAVAGYDVGWFGERLPLDEHELIAALSGDPSPQRRARAGESLLQLPVVSDRAWTAAADAIVADESPTVRARMWHSLRWQTRDRRRRLDNPDALADKIAQDARSGTPPDLEALAILRRLVFTDVAPELSSDDLERRRRAAYHLAWERWQILAEGIGQPILEQVAGRLLEDPDPLVRSEGVAAVHWYSLAGLHPRLLVLTTTETDPWTQERIRWCLFRRPAAQGSDAVGSDNNDVPPF